MALKKSEKKLLKILGGVAVVSGIILYRTFNPSAPDVVETEPLPVAETPAETKQPTGTTSTPRGSSGGGSSRSGGSGGGNTLSTPTLAGVSLDDFQNHNTYRDCWVTIGNDAYDVSSYLENNQTLAPEIGQYCGTLGFEFGFAQEQAAIIEDLKEKAQKLGPLK